MDTAVLQPWRPPVELQQVFLEILKRAQRLPGVVVTRQTLKAPLRPLAERLGIMARELRRRAAPQEAKRALTTLMRL